MHAFAKKSLAIASAVGVAGVSSIFLGAAPASAVVPPDCGSGTLLTGNICEQTFTGSGTFTATPDMTKLQVLLVGTGGSGGYGGGGGGGGAVKIVDFDGGSAPTLTINAGQYQAAASVSDGTTTVTAAFGKDAVAKTDSTPAQTGVSGNGHKGYPWGTIGGGGGGAHGSPAHRRDGGAGIAANKVTVKTVKGKAVSPYIKLFAKDTNCYSGGGAVGNGTTNGKPGCNGGFVAAGGTITAPTANMGGGGGGLISTTDTGGNPGSNGVVIVRWNATPAITLSFNDGKPGHNPKAQHLLAGTTPTKPTSPSVRGYKFLGWYTDAARTTKASFTDPLDSSAVFYGKFKKK